MDINKMFLEEDLFPREITTYEEREYGVLFYNDDNKDSYDSNHAIIFKDKIQNVDSVLEEIKDFYLKKGITPNIYQSIAEEGYFEEIQEELSKYGFDIWTETQQFMIKLEENKISTNKDIEVKIVTEWNDDYGIEIFEKAGEPWGIDVAKRSLDNSNTLFFVAFYEGKPVGMTYAHVTDEICRVDYLLVSKEYRKIGVGRTLISHFVDYCNANKINDCYLWPDGESAEKIYYEAGFRLLEIKQAGRAVCNGV